jgi:sarcosine oxidase
MSRVPFASACSGHGFKHSAALGEALAQLLDAGRSAIDLSCFSLARLAMGYQTSVDPSYSGRNR